LKIPARLLLLILALSTFLAAQDGNVRGTISVLHAKREFSNGDVVVSLTGTAAKGPVAPGPMARLLQKDKRFTPHVVAVTVGTAIEFPNRDPFFHDVFSLYHGKPFDLGLYESGSARSVRFTRPGVSYIFCNIHPDMSAVVVALPTPYFAVSARDGSFHIDHVPPGKYKVELWYELASPPDLTSLSREVEITSGENVLPALTLHASDSHSDHLNKYGEPYPLDKGSKY
jgi:plastocyanin